MIWYLDHWPPTPEEVLEALAFFDLRDGEVGSIYARPGDFHKILEDVMDGGRIWNIPISPPAEDAPLQVMGFSGGLVTLMMQGPAAGPALKPFFVPPREPVDENPSDPVIARLHAQSKLAPGEVTLTPNEYSSVRRLGRNSYTVEEDPARIAEGVMGYYTGDAHRVLVLVKG